MKQYEEKLKNYIIDNNIQAEQMIFTQSCHTVREAADAVGASPEDLVKNICMIDDRGTMIVAIVKGEDRASTSRVGKALMIDKPKIAGEDEVLEKTGFPAGGVPSFGFEATFLLDPKVLEKEIVYTGGGSAHSLVRIASRELLRANKGTVVRIRR
jgi:Cys-tRNA(Pro)/Cys-tRNA(Cys) deacylase